MNPTDKNDINQKPRGNPVQFLKSHTKALPTCLSKCFSTCADPFLPVQLSLHLIPTYLISCFLHGPHCHPTIPKFFLATQLFLPLTRPIPCPLSLLSQRHFCQPLFCLTQSSIFLTLQPQLLLAILTASPICQPPFLLIHLTIDLAYPEVLQLFLLLSHRTSYFIKLSDPSMSTQHSVLPQLL